MPDLMSERIGTPRTAASQILLSSKLRFPLYDTILNPIQIGCSNSFNSEGRESSHCPNLKTITAALQGNAGSSRFCAASPLRVLVGSHDIRPAILPRPPPWLSPRGNSGSRHSDSAGSADDFAAQDDFALEPGAPCDGR